MPVEHRPAKRERPSDERALRIAAFVDVYRSEADRHEVSAVVDVESAVTRVAEAARDGARAGAALEVQERRLAGRVARRGPAIAVRRDRDAGYDVKMRAREPRRAAGGEGADRNVAVARARQAEEV